MQCHVLHVMYFGPFLNRFVTCRLHPSPGCNGPGCKHADYIRALDVLLHPGCNRMVIT